MELICYLSNGYPTLEASFQMAGEYVQAGCGILEVDFPSHNPYLENELIKGRMKQALASCADYDEYMMAIVRLKQAFPDIKILVLVYENTVLEIGEEKFIDFCLRNDFRDILLVGLKNEDMKNRMMKAGLQVSCYIQFHMPEEEIRMAMESNGFVYLQAKPYPDQAVNPSYPTLEDCVEYLRRIGIDRPIYCGVGVHEPTDVSMVRNAGGDAVFVGSAILKLQDQIPVMKERIREFKKMC